MRGLSNCGPGTVSADGQRHAASGVALVGRVEDPDAAARAASAPRRERLERRAPGSARWTIDAEPNGAALLPARRGRAARSRRGRRRAGSSRRASRGRVPRASFRAPGSPGTSHGVLCQPQATSTGEERGQTTSAASRAPRAPAERGELDEAGRRRSIAKKGSAKIRCRALEEDDCRRSGARRNASAGTRMTQPARSDAVGPRARERTHDAERREQERPRRHARPAGGEVADDAPQVVRARRTGEPSFESASPPTPTSKRSASTTVAQPERGRQRRPRTACEARAGAGRDAAPAHEHVEALRARGRRRRRAGSRCGSDRHDAQRPRRASRPACRARAAARGTRARSRRGRGCTCARRSRGRPASSSPPPAPWRRARSARPASRRRARRSRGTLATAKTTEMSRNAVRLAASSTRRGRRAGSGAGAPPRSPKHRGEEVAERLAADEEDERLVLVRRPARSTGSRRKARRVPRRSRRRRAGTRPSRAAGAALRASEARRGASPLARECRRAAVPPC